VALKLKRQGIEHIRPLQGGLDRWRELGYPLEEVLIAAASGEKLSKRSQPIN
jgi:3-mercaptopyruvate sulfurtransferase SseA